MYLQGSLYRKLG